VSLLRVVLEYNPSLARPGCWRLTPDRSGIKARFRLGSAEETVLETRLRCLRDKRTVPDAVWFAPITSSMDVWLSEQSTFAGALGVGVALQLNGVLGDVLAVLRTW